MYPLVVLGVLVGGHAVSPGWGVLGDLGGELSFPGPLRDPIGTPPHHPEVMVATSVAVLLALPEGSPRRIADQDDGFGRPG